MFLFLSYKYGYVIEVEQSSYVIHLAYEPLCLIFHTTYMFRPSPNLGDEFYFKLVWVIVYLRVHRPSP